MPVILLPIKLSAKAYLPGCFLGVFLNILLSEKWSQVTFNFIKSHSISSYVVVTLQPINDQCSNHTESSQSICIAPN